MFAELGLPASHATQMPTTPDSASGSAFPGPRYCGGHGERSPPSPNLLSAVTLPVLPQAAGLLTSPEPGRQFSPLFLSPAGSFPKTDLGLWGSRKAGPRHLYSTRAAREKSFCGFAQLPSAYIFSPGLLGSSSGLTPALCSPSPPPAGQAPLFWTLQMVPWPHILFRNLQSVSP